MKRLSLALVVLALAAPAALAEVKANSPDGKRSASAKDKTITVIHVNTQKALLSIKAHNAVITGLAYSPDGKFIGSGDKDGVLNLFDADAGKVILTIKSGLAGSVSFTQDGKTIIVVEDKKSKKFEVATGKEVK